MWRMSVYEFMLVESISAGPALKSAICAGFEMRLGLLAYNFIMYVAIIWLVAREERKTWQFG